MRVSREQAAENRARVLEGASRLFRARGIEGVAVSELMAESGLTHGGFYGQFASKDALAVEACELAMTKAEERWRVRAEKGGAALIRQRYLSETHCTDPGNGCALAALGVDVARSRNRDLRRSFSDGFRALVNVLADALPGGAKARRQRALAEMCTMVGAVVLARAADDAELREEVLSAAAQAMR